MDYQEMHRINIERKSLPNLQKWGIYDVVQSGSFVEFTKNGVAFRLTQEQVMALFDLPLIPKRVLGRRVR